MTVQKGLIPVLAAPMIDPAAGRIDIMMPSGSTIAEIVKAALPDLALRDQHHCRVALVSERGSVIIPADRWHRVRPAEGIRVVIRLVPGKSVLRSILMIVVAVAAMAIGQWWAGTILGLKAGTIGYALASGAMSIGVSVIGNLLINALIPPDKPPAALEQQNRYQLSGWRNSLEPGAAVPLPLGTIRVAPPFAAYSYSEIVGDWQYLRSLFVFGYGRLQISDFRIGDTDLNEYDEVEIEVRDGVESDAPVTLFPKQILEESVGSELLMPFPRDDLGEIVSGSSAAEDPVVRTTGADASGASVIIGWPAGLVRYDGSGNAISHSVSVRIRQRRIDADAWQDVTTLNVTARKLEAFYRQHTWDFPSRGRWQVEVTMLTAETTSSQIQQRTSWVALQTIRPEYPLNFGKPLAIAALRIKATHQLNGQLDNFNALVSRICLDYDHESGQWVERATSNPAAIYRYALQTPANPRPVGDAGINLDELEEWHDFCRINDLKYDADQREKTTTLRDLLTEIAAAGRATARHDGVKWTVTVDRPDKLIVDHINPRNSYDFSVSRSYVSPPDGFRIEFLDASNDYKSAERIVPWPGKEDDDIVLTEELSLPGKTDPNEIYREARRRMFEAMHRPDLYNVSQDGGPARVASRGDRVRLSSDVISTVQIAARVVSAHDQMIVIDNIASMEEGKSYAVRFRTGLSETDTIGTSVVRTVVTVEGQTQLLMVNGDGAMPLAGDLIHFGEAASLDYDLVITAAEAGEDFSVHYRMIDLAPVIDELLAADPIPAWSRRAGAEVDGTALVPPVPRITSIVSGFLGTGVEGQIDYLIQPGSGSVTTASYEIEHRLSGATVWSSITIPAANGGGSISGYANGNAVQMRARAKSAGGVASAYTAVISFTIGTGDAGIPVALPSATISVTPSLGSATIMFQTGDDANVASVQVYRSTSSVLNRETDAAGSPVPVEASRTYTTSLGDTTRVNLLTAAWAAAAGWSVSSGIATKTAGSASSLSMALAAVAGKYYRVSMRLQAVAGGDLTPRLTGGSVRSGTARNANGTFSDRIQAVTGNATFELAASAAFAGQADQIVAFEETSTCIDAGTHYIWLEPQNSLGVPGPVAGPFTVTVR